LIPLPARECRRTIRSNLVIPSADAEMRLAGFTELAATASAQARVEPLERTWRRTTPARPPCTSLAGAKAGGAGGSVAG